jgi:hypothetical protein
MPVTPPGPEAVHLGDGAYAEFDGYHIWLKAEREHGWEGVALEPSSWQALRMYAKRFINYQ